MGILVSLVGWEQNLLGEEHNYFSFGLLFWHIVLRRRRLNGGMF